MSATYGLFSLNVACVAERCRDVAVSRFRGRASALHVAPLYKRVQRMQRTQRKGIGWRIGDEQPDADDCGAPDHLRDSGRCHGIARHHCGDAEVALQSLRWHTALSRHRWVRRPIKPRRYHCKIAFALRTLTHFQRPIRAIGRPKPLRQGGNIE